MIRREEGRKKVRIHIVQKGDTLWKIAKEYGISFEDLKRLNVHLANPDYIVPGMEIILPERIHKEAPVQPKQHVKESVKKEVPKPTPPSAPAPAPKPTPMPMPEPQMMPIPYPMPMPMPMPQPQVWMQPPLEMNWNQQLIMPQMEQPELPPIHIQTPAPQPTPAPPPVSKPTPPSAPLPQPQMQMMPQVPHCPSCHQPQMHMIPQMPMVPHCSSCHQPQIPMMPHCSSCHQPQMPMMPHCSSCHQPIHHQMMWPMPMPMPMPMPLDEGQYTMPAYDGKGAEKFQESSSFSSLFDVKHKHQHQEMNQPCGTPPQMMPEHHLDHYQPPCAPWMPPQFYPGGMTPYRW